MERLSMRKIREVLRLRYAVGLSTRQVAASVQLAHSAQAAALPGGATSSNTTARYTRQPARPYPSSPAVMAASSPSDCPPRLVTAPPHPGFSRTGPGSP